MFFLFYRGEKKPRGSWKTFRIGEPRQRWHTPTPSEWMTAWALSVPTPSTSAPAPPPSVCPLSISSSTSAMTENPEACTLVGEIKSLWPLKASQWNTELPYCFLGEHIPCYCNEGLCRSLCQHCLVWTPEQTMTLTLTVHYVPVYHITWIRHSRSSQT